MKPWYTCEYSNDSKLGCCLRKRFKGRFGFLTSEVRSPSHLLGAHEIKFDVVNPRDLGVWGRPGGGEVGVSCGSLGEEPGESPFVSVEVFHEILVWYNINQCFGNQALSEVIRS